MIRVCAISQLFLDYLGGSETQAIHLFREYQKNPGLRLFVLSRRLKGRRKTERVGGIKVIRLWNLYSCIYDFEDKNRLKNILSVLSFIASVYIFLIKNRREYDLIHYIGASVPTAFTTILAKILNKKIVAKVSTAKIGTEAGSLKGKYFLWGNLLAWMLKKIDKLIAISNEIREDLLKEGYPSEKIAFIPNAVNTSLFCPAKKEEKILLRKKLNLPVKGVIISFTGRLVKRKGLVMLLYAFKDIVKIHPRAYLIILGSGAQKKKLQKLARKFKINSNVVFTGFVKNVADFLKSSDIFVFPSHQEGLPNSVLEAMACRLPTVASKIGGVVDLIEDKKQGLLVPLSNTQILKKVLLILVRKRRLRAKLGRAAEKKAVKFYSIKTCVERYLKLYEQILKTSLKIPEKLNILHVVPYYYPAWEYGGTPRAVYEITRHQEKMGHNLSVFTTDVFAAKKRVPFGGFRKIGNINIFYAKNLSNWLAFGQKFFTGVKIPGKDTITPEKIDLIHLHEYRTLQNIFLSIFAINKSIPYIISPHGSAALIGKKIILKKLFDVFFGKKILKRAKKVIVLSQIEKTTILSLGVPENKIATITHGIHIEQPKLPLITKKFRQRNIFPGQKVILYLGRINPIKGLEFLIRGFAKAAQRVPNLILCLAGPDEKHQKHLEKLIKKLNLSPRVSFVGMVDLYQKQYLMRRAVLGVCPSKYDAFNLTAIEFIASKLPLIVSDQVGAAEFLGPYVETIPFGDPAKLSQKIIEMLKNYSFFKKKVIQGSQKISDQFSWGRIAQNYSGLYRNVIQEYKQ